MNTTEHARRSAVAGQVERGVRPAAPKRADFDTPHEVTDADCAFPARAMDLMPEYSHIPGDRVKPNVELSRAHETNQPERDASRCASAPTQG